MKTAEEWTTNASLHVIIRAIQRDALEAAAKVLHENYDTADQNHKLRQASGRDGWADHSNGRLEGISDSISWIEELIPKATP